MNDPNHSPMDDREILDKLQKEQWELVRYFSNDNKRDRERWTVGKFLSILNVPYEDGEIVSLEQSDKTDAVFRDAFFQVKELTDPNIRRGEIKDVYKSIKAARTLDEVRWVGEVQDVPDISNMYQLVLEMTAALSEKYEASKRSELDLLIYVTRTAASLIQQQEINGEAFSSLGWRSVSCLNAKQAVVLFASIKAPGFLREKSEILINCET
jgi:hypothetical protein